MLQLVILTGDFQGASHNLFEGFKIGFTEDCDLQIPQKKFKDNDFLIKCSSSGAFTLHTTNKKPLIISGEENLSQIDLLPGLIFSIDNIGFSIQEATDSLVKKEKEKQNFITLYEKLDFESTKNLRIFPNQNISFTFVRGLLLGQSWPIPWSPISFGKKSSLLFFLDESIPSDLDFLTLTALDDGFNISSDIPNFVSINGKILNDPKQISNGDFVEFTQTAFYIELK